MDYIHHTNGVIDQAPQALPKSWKADHWITGLDKADAETLRNLGWLPVTYVNETYDPETQVHEGPTGCNIGDSVSDGATEAVGTYTVREKTQDELDAETTADLNRAGAKGILALVALIDKLIEKGVISAADFDVVGKEAYQYIKPIADRLRA